MGKMLEEKCGNQLITNNQMEKGAKMDKQAS